ncbi:MULTISPECIES: hypothetical protein [Streptomyces]|nr:MULTISPECIES: hypothetical protein [Streptomyces]MDF9871325.1 hypothetical protein [Streptomyces pratensis]MCY1652534.1 hypothetical protein [Streptomyces sp. SL203]MDX3184151.1 hypothetical protein [Streptomyces sp. ME02-7008A-1]WSK29378.1 hypothetical protein OG483_16525 [[Kitasatospora] papulosa]WSZ49004.1 hypothetical protein OG337_17400 [[Kitasatospora] papulosa]
MAEAVSRRNPRRRLPVDGLSGAKARGGTPRSPGTSPEPLVLERS